MGTRSCTWDPHCEWMGGTQFFGHVIAHKEPLYYFLVNFGFISMYIMLGEIIKLLVNGGLVANLLLHRNFIYLLCLMTLFIIFGRERHLKPLRTLR